MVAKPVENGDVSVVLRKNAARGPDRPFLTFTESPKRYSYGEFDALVNRAANALTKLGVQYGAFVNFVLPNSVEYLVASFAVRRLGAVEVAVNCEARGPALARMLSLSPGAPLIIGREFLPYYEAIASEIVAPSAVIVVGAQEAPRGAMHFEELLDLGAESDPRIEVNPLDAVMVIFTSGTTGPPKGCLLSHRGIIRSAESIYHALDLTRDDRVYTAYPLFHGRASSLDVLAAMLPGGQVVLAPKFTASRFWDHMHDFDVSMFSIIGTVMQIIWKQPRSPRDKDHKVRITWGGPITVEPALFEERFGVPVLPGDGVFGMTETGVVNMSSFNPEESGKIRSIYEVRIGGENDEALAPGEVGEILVRPREPGVLFSGYAGMPDATIASWRNLWFHTGDLGKMDAQDRMTFVGRKKERIRSGGHNISSWEVEEVLDRHDGVLECAVIGVPSDLGEEDVKAYVVLQPNATLTKDELLAFCRDNMARFMVPRHIEFIEEMPKTQSGKPAKGRLGEMHKQSLAR